MQIREGPRRQAQSAAGAMRSPMSAMMLAMFATMATFYVAGRNAKFFVKLSPTSPRRSTNLHILIHVNAETWHGGVDEIRRYLFQRVHP